MASGVANQKASSLLPTLVKTIQSQQLLSSSKPFLNQNLPSLRCAISLYNQINLINNVPEDQLWFQGYTDTGFTVNGVKYEGSILIVENKLISWAPKRFSEIISESLSIFKVLRPFPEIVILGYGKNIELVSLELRRFIRSTGMKLEAVDSRNAASTYNILNEEGRVIATALIPFGVS